MGRIWEGGCLAKKDGFVNLSDEKMNGKSSCFLMVFDVF